MNRREQILTKVVAIAKRNGFGIDDDFFTTTPTSLWLQDGQDLYFSLLLNKDFAKCFWGEDDYMGTEEAETAKQIDLEDYENPVAFLLANRENVAIPEWQFHLIQMTLSDDPLEYISQFIEEKDNSLS